MRAGVTEAARRGGPVIDVAICLDEALLLPAAVLLQSIAEHADASRPVRVHALTTFPVERLTALAPAAENGVLELVAIEVGDRFAGLPRNHYISQGTYLRFLLPDLLQGVGRLIYLDVDMVVHRPLGPLFDVDLADTGLGAASDASLALGSTRWDHFDLAYDGRQWTFADYCRDVLGLGQAHDEGVGRESDAYFNAGLLLVDLQAWRTQDVARRVLAFIAAQPNLKFMDQDALSHVMQGRYIRLDTRWNAMANCADKADGRLRTRLSADGRRWERIRGLWRDDPWIVHFAGPHKPWNADRPVVHGDIWWDYARRSAAWPRLAAASARYRAVCEAAAGRKRSWIAATISRLRRR